MRTLAVRMPIHCANAKKLANKLTAHPKVESVIHPSLPNHADFEVANRVMPNGTGMLSFTEKGGDTAATK